MSTQIPFGFFHVSLNIDDAQALGFRKNVLIQIFQGEEDGEHDCIRLLQLSKVFDQLFDPKGQEITVKGASQSRKN